MKVSEKLSVIDTIARTLQQRYTYTEIDSYLSEFGIRTPDSHGDFNSKWVYSKHALRNVSLEVLGRIADDLGLGVLAHVSASTNPPAIWKGANEFRLFISHLSKDKDKATRLRDCLKRFGIKAFVAHEDIHPTLTWQAEIERALFVMDAMVAIHTPGFANSFWTQQEIGFALGRGIKVISLKMGEDPKGFISSRQALARRRKTAEQIAIELYDLLMSDDLTKSKLTEAQNRSGIVIFANDEIPF